MAEEETQRKRAETAEAELEALQAMVAAAVAELQGQQMATGVAFQQMCDTIPAALDAVRNSAVETATAIAAANLEGEVGPVKRDLDSFRNDAIAQVDRVDDELAQVRKERKEGMEEIALTFEKKIAGSAAIAAANLEEERKQREKETARATAAEAGLKAKVEAEEARAMAVEETLNDDLVTEVTEREVAVREVEELVNAEAHERWDDDQKLENAMEVRFEEQLQGRWEDSQFEKEARETAIKEAIDPITKALEKEGEQRKAQDEMLKKKVADCRGVAEAASAKARDLAHPKGPLVTTLTELRAGVATNAAGLGAEAALRRADAVKSEAGDEKLAMQIGDATMEATTEEMQRDTANDGELFFL